MATDGDERLKGALAYLVGPVTGVILLLTEKKNEFIRFHAMQSILVFGAVILFEVALGLVPILGRVVSFLISPVMNIIAFIIWLFLMFKAYNGEKYHFPYFGDLAEKQLEKLGK